MPRHTVTIAQWGYDNLMYLPLYVAIHASKQNTDDLTITLTRVGSDDDVLQAVLNKKADFGFGDPIFVEDHKEKATCLAVIVKRTAIWGITHNPAIPELKTPEDFVQLRIGCFPHPSTVHGLLSNLKTRHKRLLKNTHIVEAPIGQQADLLTGNKADIVMELEPLISLAESKGLRTVLSLPDYFDDMPVTGLTTLNTTIQRNPDTARRLVALLQYGLNICHTEPDIALDVAAHVFPNYPRPILQKAIRRLRQHKIWPRTTDIHEKEWQTAIKIKQR